MVLGCLFTKSSLYEARDRVPGKYVKITHNTKPFTTVAELITPEHLLITGGTI